jgi:hypothetical protein
MTKKQTSRVSIYQEFESEPGPCPRCGGTLLQQHQLYVVATRRGKELTDTFMLSGDFGWYCEACPTVVINPAKVGRMLSFSKPGWDTGEEFTVLGLVDLSAVPRARSHLPLGDDDNPIPLVEFTGLPGRPGTGSRATQQGTKHPGSKPARSRRTVKKRRR